MWCRMAAWQHVLNGDSSLQRFPERIRPAVDVSPLPRLPPVDADAATAPRQ